MYQGGQHLFDKIETKWAIKSDMNVTNNPETDPKNF